MKASVSRPAPPHHRSADALAPTPAEDSRGYSVRKSHLHRKQNCSTTERRRGPSVGAGGPLRRL